MIISDALAALTAGKSMTRPGRDGAIFRLPMASNKLAIYVDTPGSPSVMLWMPTQDDVLAGDWTVA